MSIWGSVKKIASGPIGLVAAPLLTAPFKLAGSLFSSLMPTMPTAAGGQSLPTPGATYDANIRANLARLGDPKTIVYGTPPPFYPDIVAPSFTRFVGNRQYWCGLFHLSVGDAGIDAAGVGEIDRSLLDWEEELLPPGAPLTLFHPHVHTVSSMSGVELKGGKLYRIEQQGTVTFSGGNRITFSSNWTHSPAVGARKRAWVVISGSSLNNRVSGPITNAGSNWIETSVGISSGSSSATIGYDTEWTDEDINTKLSDWMTITFNAGGSYAQTSLDDGFDQVQIEDIVYFEGSTSNDNLGFFVSDITYPSGGGMRLALTPAPESQTASSARVLLYRREGVKAPLCPPGLTVSHVEADVVAEALYSLDSSGDGSPLVTRSVPFFFIYRRINDAGDFIDGWQQSYRFLVEDATTTPVRRSFRFEFPTPARYVAALVQARPPMEENSSEQAREHFTVYALKGYVYNAPATDPDCTRYAVRVWASGALAQAGATQVKVTAYGMVRPYDNSAWQNKARTSSPAFIAADYLVANSRGRITYEDLPSPALFRDYCTANSIYYDAVLRDQAPLWDRVNEIMQYGQGRYLQTSDGGLRIVFDEETTPSFALIDGLNCDIDSYTIEPYHDEMATGVLVQFTDPRTGALRKEDDAPCAGSRTSPRIITLDGCTRWDQAYRYAWREWREILYRTRSVSMTADLRVRTRTPNQRVLIASVVTGWGQGVEVRSVSGLTLTVYPSVQWRGGQAKARLAYPSLGADWINCSRGSRDDEIILSSSLGTLDSGNDPAQLLMQWPDSKPVTGIVSRVSPQDVDGFALEAIIDDDRVYDAPPSIPADPLA